MQTRLAAACAVLAGASYAQAPQVAPLPGPAANQAHSLTDAFRKMSADTWVTRTVSLAELGIAPVVLGYTDSTREVSLPVPPNTPLVNATLQVDASFVRADGGRTTLILSLDGVPASARPVTSERGDGSLTLAVDGAPRPNGAVRFAADWRTAIARENTCADVRTPGNLLRIEPTTRLSYRFDTGALRDLPAAWAALPANPVVLLSSSRVSAQVFDTAWRVGVALERAGKHPRIRTLPAVGDVVDLSNVTVPQVLKRIPAFAALAEASGSGKRKVRDAAEVGALVALGNGGPVHADIVIGDRAVAGALAQALDELRAQVPADALDAFNEWRELGLDGWSRQLAAGQVRVATAFGSPAIVVAQDAGADAAALFAQPAGGSSMNAAASGDDPRGDVSAVSLKYLGAKPATLDVLSRADWTTSFPIGAVAGDGRLPSTLVIDVAAAPGAARTAPVASVFLNDVLLSARELDAGGRRERIIAPVPRHVLSAQNTVRVSFVRQAANDRCRESPEAYPVSVLASSHVLLDKVETGADFSGVIARFARGGGLMVPVGYLQDAQNTLPRVIALAASTGLSPVRARFDAVADTGPHKAKGPFLAMDVVLKDVESEVRIEAGRLYAASDRPLLDIGGLQRAGVVEVAKQGDVTGVVYRTIGREGPVPDRPFQLSQGNVAVLASNGLRAEINTWDPTGQSVVGEQRATLPVGRNLWVVWALVLAFLAGVAGFGWMAWRRRVKAACA